MSFLYNTSIQAMDDHPPTKNSRSAMHSHSPAAFPYLSFLYTPCECYVSQALFLHYISGKFQLPVPDSEYVFVLQLFLLTLPNC